MKKKSAVQGKVVEGIINIVTQEQKQSFAACMKSSRIIQNINEHASRRVHRYTKMWYTQWVENHQLIGEQIFLIILRECSFNFIMPVVKGGRRGFSLLMTPFGLELRRDHTFFITNRPTFKKIRWFLFPTVVYEGSFCKTTKVQKGCCIRRWLSFRPYCLINWPHLHSY